jgi:hypothetical protein
MKPYPTTSFEGCDQDFRPTGIIHVVPTPESIRNFELYLDPEELKIYQGLPHIDALRIAMSCNPFNAFLTMVKKLEL